MTQSDKQAETCCNCADSLPEDLSVRLNHWMDNFEFQGWRFCYDTLAAPGEDNGLCKYGRCRSCGKCLCLAFSVPVGQSTDSFLATAYRWMHQLWNAEHPSYMDFREIFADVFHEEDRAYVRHWLSLPENQHVYQMYRHDAGGPK